MRDAFHIDPKPIPAARPAREVLAGKARGRIRRLLSACARFMGMGPWGPAGLDRLSGAGVELISAPRESLASRQGEPATRKEASQIESAAWDAADASPPPETPASESLLAAARLGDAAEVRRALAAGVNPNLGYTQQGLAALALAARFGHAECVELLIQAGAKLDIPGIGASALSLAAIAGEASCVDRLLRAGARTDIASASGHGVLFDALHYERGDCAALLAAAGAKLGGAQAPAGLPLDILATSPDMLRMLIHAGGDHDAADLRGVSLVHRAARRHGIEPLRILVEAGAKIDGSDNSGRTPAAHAREADCMENALFIEAIMRARRERETLHEHASALTQGPAGAVRRSL